MLEAGQRHQPQGYGVTSEGIFRWIDLVLPLAGISEGGAYTVKMTGGPDGDVGGNLLRILHREHGARVKVLAISDGTGAAHDPAGLAWPELLRLVDESQGIAKFAPARLRGPGARVVPATDKVGEQVRNTLHNTVAADLFLPCGGRPYTINDGNWEAFLGADGKPSAKAMVEGANIFLTPIARTNLERAGLVVIKDSSANKGGVICSSYEVLAGLVLSDEEFIADKPRYVARSSASSATAPTTRRARCCRRGSAAAVRSACPPCPRSSATRSTASAACSSRRSTSTSTIPPSCRTGSATSRRTAPPCWSRSTASASPSASRARTASPSSPSASPAAWRTRRG